MNKNKPTPSKTMKALRASSLDFRLGEKEEELTEGSYDLSIFMRSLFLRTPQLIYIFFGELLKLLRF